MGIQPLHIVENIVAKGEIAHIYEQFFLLPQCFQKLSAAKARERVNVSSSPVL